MKSITVKIKALELVQDLFKGSNIVVDNQTFAINLNEYTSTYLHYYIQKFEKLLNPKTHLHDYGNVYYLDFYRMEMKRLFSEYYSGDDKLQWFIEGVNVKDVLIELLSQMIADTKREQELNDSFNKLSLKKRVDIIREDIDYYKEISKEEANKYLLYDWEQIPVPVRVNILECVKNKSDDWGYKEEYVQLPNSAGVVESTAVWIKK